MATYDVQQRIKLIGVFYSSERSIIETQRKYRQHFNVRISPSDNMIPGNYISINCIPKNALFGAVLWLKELSALFL
jgi:hypothetical protein